MRIFNWVHKKFHNKDDVWNAEGSKKDDQEEAHTLIEQVPLCDVIDTWKQGLLTIGTFGYDPLLNDFSTDQLIIAKDDQQQAFEQQEDGHNNDDDDDDKRLDCFESCDDEEEFEREHNPLVLHAFKHAFNTTSTNGRRDQNVNYAHDDDEPEIVEVISYDHDEKKNGKRITLADLFSADSEDYNNVKITKADHGDDDDKVEVEEDREKVAHGKPKLSFANKFIPRVKDNSNPHSRPIKKIHRMMTRMLKRKIHPDLEGKYQKKGNQMQQAENGAVETASLLQTQGATMCV